MYLSKLLNCCLYLSLEACGTPQSLGTVTMGDIAEGDEEEELIDARSSSDEALFIPEEESPSGEEKGDEERGIPEAKAPAGTGWSIPMVPFGRVAFPTVGIRGLEEEEAIRGLMPVAVGTKGVRPVIGVKGESPGVAMEIGVNIARFVMGIMGMLAAIP